MPYFSNMPTFDYPSVVDGKTKFINSRNILVRAKFLDYIKDAEGAYLTYTIRDGERPETLAYRVYGQSDLHWVILMFNEIIDPLFEWPLSTHDLDSAIATKYSGKTLFIDMRNVIFEKNGLTRKASEELWYEVGGTVRQGNAEGKVLAWDPNLYKIVIEQTSPSTTSFTRTLGVDSPNNQNRDLIHQRSDGSVLYAAVGKFVDDNRKAAHHFKDSDTGDVIDHHSLLKDENGGILDTNIIVRYAVFAQEFIPLPSMDVAAVTNYEYEMEKNEAKRNIKMMRPELLDVVIKDMRRVFGG